VRDVSIVESPDEVEFDVIITEVIEQPSATSEEDLNQVDRHLVDLSGAQKRLGGPRPVDHDRTVTGCGASLTGAVLDIGDETCVAGWHVPVVHLVGEHEDRHPVVMVALPALGEFECPTAGDHCAGRHRFAVDRSGGAVGFPIVEPVEKPFSVTSELCPGRSSGPAM
jgi:hypothetical protein